ncbi:NADPH-dependent oxidoreductase [Halomonas sp. ZH2S]|uniref:NADPH-dependent oxidoreductase n=1 Tax=Vreelandella zhuhanensis TaxID=2684210 RepID=A0A7X3GYS4_9GAMM|nr:NAD(P)H-dependent oxidoreductase [Halomonas zhuhanensis]MWJ27039.1 NADPH-dependent oxidoreductase [Halomonas zhuhanensis]
MPHFLVFLGTIRNSTPPAPARLGLRVARTCVQLLEADGASVELIDPLEIEFGAVFKPHFAYAKAKVPETLETLADKIEAADGYIMVSPEYNHSMSPVLAHLLNHFGSSLYAFKPSAIVTYSAGQWGGVRAAVAMRTFLAELGCLPVSAMIHVPKAQEALDEDGRFREDPDRWASYFGRALGQLGWWAEAAARHREIQDPREVSPAFQRAPEQRNAPASE